ncbi:hypothetical protein [Actinopolymorpha pittospori]|uniref:Uncharacterized protein n=1 Tax=Actinopolymorpha pittospori TaxID=648752 RepID=A0A927R5W5_9ACTN|nr:hypothetical protein [Actinopolymorpha pittospori]MBE1603767.1 hypothetical protein [Actinopolymorpha pittospori]
MPRSLGPSEMTFYRTIHARECPAVRIRGRLIVLAKAPDDMVGAALNAQAIGRAADRMPGGGVA